MHQHSLGGKCRDASDVLTTLCQESVTSGKPELMPTGRLKLMTSPNKFQYPLVLNFDIPSPKHCINKSYDVAVHFDIVGRYQI